MGDVCPVTKEDMVDINTGNEPRTLSMVPLNSANNNRSGGNESKGKKKQSAPGGILDFFGELAITPMDTNGLKLNTRSSRVQANQNFAIVRTCRESSRFTWNDRWGSKRQTNADRCHG
jgi:hypothetical protein